MSNNDQPETPSNAANADALSRFLQWMKATIVPSRSAEIRRAVLVARSADFPEPADLGLPSLMIPVKTPSRSAQSQKPAGRLPGPQPFSQPDSATIPNPHEDYIRRRFKL